MRPGEHKIEINLNPEPLKRILNFELKMKKKISLHVMFWTLLECFVSNVSMLSRGMILNFSGLFLK